MLYRSPTCRCSLTEWIAHSYGRNIYIEKLYTSSCDIMWISEVCSFSCFSVPTRIIRLGIHLGSFGWGSHPARAHPTTPLPPPHLTNRSHTWRFSRGRQRPRGCRQPCGEIPGQLPRQYCPSASLDHSLFQRRIWAVFWAATKNNDEQKFFKPNRNPNGLRNNKMWKYRNDESKTEHMTL